MYRSSLFGFIALTTILYSSLEASHFSYEWSLSSPSIPKIKALKLNKLVFSSIGEFNIYSSGDLNLFEPQKPFPISFIVGFS